MLGKIGDYRVIDLDSNIITIHGRIPIYRPRLISITCIFHFLKCKVNRGMTVIRSNPNTCRKNSLFVTIKNSVRELKRKSEWSNFISFSFNAI